MLKTFRFCSLFLGWCLATAFPLYAQNSASPADLNIRLGERRVTFAPTRSFQEMRLEVVNSIGEIVFTYVTTEAELDWNLRAANSEALAPGLYRYALTLKFSEEQSRQHTGHFIVEKGLDQIWLTAHEGAEISGATLNVARTGGRSLAGLRTSEDQTKRDVSGRGLTEEKANGTLTEDKPGLREKAALAGTVNRLAKYAADGTTLVDSTLSEIGGTLSFGTPSPIWQVTSAGQSQTYDTTSGLQAGFSAYTHRHAANISNYPRTLMLGYSPGTTINYGFYAAAWQATGTTQIPSFFGISTNANVKQVASKQMFLYQSPTAGVISVLSSENLGAGQGTDLFLGGSTANGADAPLTIKTNGNVGIGTPTPGAKLEVNSGLGNNAVMGYSFRNDGGTSSGYGVIGYSQFNDAVVGYSESPNHSGVYGYAVGNGAGVHGQNNFGGVGLRGVSNSGLGVVGTSDTGIGVRGIAIGATGTAVNAIANHSSGVNYGVHAISSSSSGFGVYGRNATSSGRSEAYVGTAGIWGDSGSGVGVYATSDSNYAIAGVAGSSNLAGFFRGSVDIIGNAFITGNANITGNVLGRQFMNDVQHIGGSYSQQACWTSGAAPYKLGICNTSSLRYKTEVQSFRGGLDLITRLRPIAFTWKEGGLRDIGLGAEEVAQVEPLLAFRNAKGEVEGVRYTQLSAVFINAFKEQQTQIETLQQQNTLLRQQNAAILKRLETVERSLVRKVRKRYSR